MVILVVHAHRDIVYGRLLKQTLPKIQFADL